jgi:hypothetical protein
MDTNKFFGELGLLGFKSIKYKYSEDWAVCNANVFVSFCGNSSEPDTGDLIVKVYKHSIKLLDSGGISSQTSEVYNYCLLTTIFYNKNGEDYDTAITLIKDKLCKHK